MKEEEMQKNLLKYLEKKFKKANVHSEYPFIHGTADILMKIRNSIYVFELKLKVNSRLFNQATKHKLVADYIFVVALLPKRKDVCKKWELKAKLEKLNIIWWDNLDKKQIKKAVQNNIVNRDIRRRTYGL